MKPSCLPIALLLLTAVATAWRPAPASGGPKTYDLDLLLNEPHLFTGTASAHAPSSGPLGPLQTARADAQPDPVTETALTAVTVFGGVMTDNEWEDVFTPHEIDFRDSTLLGVAVSKPVWRFADRLSLEIEGQIVRHFEKQDHWEFNLPAVARWHAFPWDRWVETSFAFGLGPSYATDTPKEEAVRSGESHQWLVHWFAEIELGLPDSRWSGLFRLHHRSGAFGAVADEGGSNVLAIGLRRRF